MFLLCWMKACTSHKSVSECIPTYYLRSNLHRMLTVCAILVKYASFRQHFHPCLYFSIVYEKQALLEY